jgi:hypothetical protein
MTQAQRILIYLKTGKSLTPLEALKKFGCFRLAARIADLRNQGHTIWTNYITKDNKTFAAYKLSSNGNK